MKNYYNLINNILSPGILKEAKLVIILIIFSEILEFIGIGLFITIIAIIFNQDNFYLKSNTFESFCILNNKFSNNEVVVFCIILFLIIFFFKNLILTFSSAKEYKFIFKTKKFLSEKLLKNYIYNEENFLNIRW